MRTSVFYIFAFAASLLFFAGLAYFPQDGSPSQVLILASAVLGAIAYILMPRIKGKTINWPSSVRIAGVRLCFGIALGLFSGGVMLLCQLVSGFIHPLDRWHALYVYECVGGISGIVVGLFWGITAVRNGDSPSSRENSDPPPNAP